MMRLTIYSDGGARGNPGASAYAIVVCDGKDIIFEKAEFIGMNTNNVAEYRGLIAGIGKAIDLGADDVEFVMDSELVIKQMRGEYKVRSPHLIDLYHDARSLVASIDKVKFTHVKRANAMITRADMLLNEEMDKNQ